MFFARQQSGTMASLLTPQKACLMLSIIVVLHNMPEQAWNTLQSLFPGYQQLPADALAFEVIVVENRSANTLNSQRIDSLPDNFHYHLRDEEGVSPAAAINFGLSKARGDIIGLLIDGARMLSPGVLPLLSDALRAYPNILLNVPGYYLTAEGEAADSSVGDSDTAIAEQAYLQSLNWQDNGYCLFERAVFSNGNRQGFLRPFMESTAFFVSRWALENIGGADESFQLPGGGALVLHMFRQLGLMAELDYLVLAGEGNFHQFHSGVSTRKSEQRDALVGQFKQQLDERWQGGYKALTREPVLFGKISEQALRFMQSSCELADARNRNFYGEGKPIWPDAEHLGLYHGG